MSKNLEKRIAVLESRNKRVDGDKAWETSVMRRFLISVVTFVIIGLYLTWLDVRQPWLHAVVPSVGFLLSTLAIQKVKQLWLKNRI